MLRRNWLFGGRWQSTRVRLFAGRRHTEGRRARHWGGMVGLASRPFKRSDGDKIFVSDVADIIARQSDQRLRSAGGSHELDFEGVRAINLNDRAEVSTPQPRIGNVARKYNSVEQTKH